MRLAALDPELSGSLVDGILKFDCPFAACQARGPHRIWVAVSSAPYHEREPRAGEAAVVSRNGKVKVWQATGEFPETVSLQPSVNLVDDQGNTTCWHGFVTNGEAA